MITALLLFCLMGFISDEAYRTIQNDSFQRNESYDYKVKLGFLTIGEAKVEVAKTFHLVNNRTCYLVNINGKTAGVTDLYKVRNNYRSYIDTLAIVPQRFLMNVSENKYKKEQTINFNQNKNSATIEEKGASKNIQIPDNVQDVVSSYFYFRTLNFSKMTVGESFSQKMFFDNELYDMKFKFMGREIIKTKFGKLNVFKVFPILPTNKLFDGQEAIRIWVSDDKNRIPIKVAVDMNYVGDVVLEMNTLKGNKYPIKWLK
jgi:Protein of unknown function (DUF3108)